MITLGGAADGGLLAELDAGIKWRDNGIDRRIADQGRYQLDVGPFGWVVWERRGDGLGGAAVGCRSGDAIDHMAPDERLAKHTRECVAAWQKLETEARAKSGLVAEPQPDPGLAVLHAIGEAVATVARARLVSRVADGRNVEFGPFRRSDGASWIVCTFYERIEPGQWLCFVLRYCSANPGRATELREFRGPLEDTAATIVQAMLEESAAWRDVP